jgi:hypothetical protein
MTGKLTGAGTHPLPGVLGKGSCEIWAAREPSAVDALSGPDKSELTSRALLFTTRVPRPLSRNLAELSESRDWSARRLSI